MTSPPALSSLDLDAEGSSPWGDERSEYTHTPPPPITFPTDDNAFKDTPGDPQPAVAPPATGGAAADESEQQQQHESTEQSSSSLSAPKSTPAARRTPRRPGRQVVRAEAIDDELGPLGPLGDNLDESSEPGTPLPSTQEIPPQPPVKEASPHAGRAGASSSGAPRVVGTATFDSIIEDDAADVRGHKIGVGAESQGGAGSAAAAKPLFEIVVGDPHKVGDLTSAHTVYNVRTKTTSKQYRVPEFSVARRYSDFLWLYKALNNNNPGVVVPPPPEKQAVGRFDENFVESRRAALERMLNKICQHPILLQDQDLKLFLESESLNVDIKHREKQSPLPTESKGFLGFGGGMSSKFIETDDWFHDRRQYLDALESQLKNLLKAIDGVVKQRKDLAEAANDFSSSLHALSTVELSKSLSAPLEQLSELQIRIKELHERQAAQDVLTIGITVDEYIRIIGSIKLAFQQRQKAYHSCHAAESELVKRRTMFEKLQRQGKTQQDRLTQLSAEVADSERKLHQARVLFEDMGRLMRAELDRFEREKVEDFKSGVETFLESSVEAQKELIELWESYLLQLDREEEAEAAANYGIPTASAPTSPPPQHARLAPQSEVHSDEGEEADAASHIS
ncbi:Vps5 C terminal like-domain-containing protein [Sphaerosporella brunnea]|uniref:Vps5 C terminal like-domain-containing protein n=1 Tax=Sphaerosporella brunnea TaxID=1250544 RepID=A0A5J5EQD9_9PEZI|nr:Vps5 C terminal like-domain-containing protein [Sphaerosporella brunnea]